MTVKSRPRGRGLALAGSLLLALGLVAALAPPAPAQMRAFDPEVVYPTSLLSGPDGALWMLGGAGSSAIARVTTDGGAEQVSVGFSAQDPSTDRLVPLADGGVAAALPTGAPVRWRLVTVHAGEPPRARTLPAAVDGAATAIGPDRSVWFGRACTDVLGRITPRGRIERHRLPRIGCLHVDDRAGVEQATVIRLGSDGSVWLVNRCQGRIARLRRDARIEQWRLKPICHADPETGAERPSRALAEADGGLRVERARITARGALRVGSDIVVPDFVTADGSEWWAEPGSVEVVQRTPGGRERRIAVTGSGGGITTATPAASGGLAVAVTVPEQQAEQGWSDPVDLVLVSDAGTTSRTRLALPSRYGTAEVSLSAGSDGALWATDASHAATTAWPGRALLRVPDLARHPRPRATLARVLGRDGARVWLQVACAAPPGTLCNGTVALRRPGGGSLLRAAPRYVAAGGMPVAVSALLTRAARRALRRDRVLRARASVTARTSTTHRLVEVAR